MGGTGEEGGVRGEVVALELLHQVGHLRRRGREGRRCSGGGGYLGHRSRSASPAEGSMLRWFVKSKTAATAVGSGIGRMRSELRPAGRFTNHDEMDFSLNF
jgi:hypothetical protein